MSAPSLSVVVPCYNEAGNLEPVVERIREVEKRLGVPVEIVLVDDGSADGTSEEIKQIARRDEGTIGAFHTVNRGIAAAWATGVGAATGDWVVLCDADLQYDPRDIEKLWRASRGDDSTVVQGWRVYAPGFHSPLRYGLSVVFSGLLQAAFWVRLRDIKSDFILCRRELLRAALEDVHKFRFFQHYLPVALVRRGARVRQIPVPFGNRQTGQSFIDAPFRFGLAALFELPRAVRYYWSVGRRARREAGRAESEATGG